VLAAILGGYDTAEQAAAVITAARELVAHAGLSADAYEPTVDGYDLDRLRTALAALDAAKGGK
jgi:hypothetical protein